MTKQELMETYTAEQLAEMVVELQSRKKRKVFKMSDNKNYQKELDEFLKESPIQSTIDRICRDITDQKNNAMAMEFTRVICELLRENGVYVHCTETKFSEKITENSIEKKYGIKFDSVDFSEHDKEFTDKIKELEEELEKSNREYTRTLWEFRDSVKKEDYDSEVNRLKSEVEKYRKAFDDAKKERDFRICEYQKKIEELEHDLKTAGGKIQDLAGENMKLQCERNDYKSKSEFLEVERMRVKKNEVTDFLPAEPIKVTDMLINASKKRTNCMTGKEYDKYIFEKWQLRQIAEHLLVYCNHNGEAEE